MNQNQPIMLIKFIEPQYLWSFLEGDVHFMSLNYFRKKEAEENNKVIGDIAEGDLVNQGPISKVMDLATELNCVSKEYSNSILAKVDNSLKLPFEIGISPKQRDEVGIASFFTISYKDVKRDPNQNIINGKKVYVLKNKIVKILNAFNTDNRIPVIIPFINILLGDFKIQKFTYDEVKYYDEKIYQSKIIKIIKNDCVKAAFYKRKKYSNQKEFRLVTKIHDQEKGDTINIPLLGCIAKSYGNIDLSRLAFAWQEKPVAPVLSQCESTLLLSKY